MSNQDIRAWARDQGLNVAHKGPISSAVLEQWEARENTPGVDPADVMSMNGRDPAGDTAESRPAGPPLGRKSWWTGQPKKPRDKAGPPQRRVSIENLVSGAWGLGAWFTARSAPNLLPVARVLDMQAPVSGVIVNDLAKGTALDRALQPLARMEEKGGKAGALLGPPVIVAAMTMRPELFPVLRPFLKMSLLSYLEVSAPAMKKIQDRAKKFEDKVGVTDGEIDAMIEALFAPPPAGTWETATSPEEEEAIRRAQERG
jgi:hypothetical protein